MNTGYTRPSCSNLPISDFYCPVCLILTRQAVPTLDRAKYASADGVSHGAYVLAGAPDQEPDVLLLSTGSEVSLCVTAYEQSKAEGIKARVISMPSWELFEKQSQKYRDSVLPPGFWPVSQLKKHPPSVGNVIPVWREAFSACAALVCQRQERLSHSTSASTPHILLTRPGNKLHAMQRMHRRHPVKPGI